MGATAGDRRCRASSSHESHHLLRRLQPATAPPAVATAGVARNGTRRNIFVQNGESSLNLSLACIAHSILIYRLPALLALVECDSEMEMGA